MIHETATVEILLHPSEHNKTAVSLLSLLLVPYYSYPERKPNENQGCSGQLVYRPLVSLWPVEGATLALFGLSPFEGSKILTTWKSRR